MNELPDDTFHNLLGRGEKAFLVAMKMTKYANQTFPISLQLPMTVEDGKAEDRRAYIHMCHVVLCLAIAWCVHGNEIAPKVNCEAESGSGWEGARSTGQTLLAAISETDTARRLRDAGQDVLRDSVVLQGMDRATAGARWGLDGQSKAWSVTNRGDSVPCRGVKNELKTCSNTLFITSADVTALVVWVLPDI